MGSADEEPPRGGERWGAVYRDDAALFDAFSRAEDPEGRVFARLGELGVPPGGRVVELGAGTGRVSRALAGRAGTYVAVEPLASMALCGAGGSGARWLRARGEALPLAPSSCDAALATWLLADLRPPLLTGVLAEADRVLRHGGHGLWALENGWGGELQELRGLAGAPARRAIAPLLAAGFEVVEEHASELRFTNDAECRRVLGTILGGRVAAELGARPRSRLGMDLVILHRAAQRRG